MTCKYCGEQLKGSARICDGCGKAVLNSGDSCPKPKRRITGFVLTLSGFLLFITFLPGFFVSIGEFIAAKREGSPKRYAIAGIIISTVVITVFIVAFSFFAALLSRIWSEINSYYAITFI